MNEHELTNYEPANDEPNTGPELRDRVKSAFRAVRSPDADLDVFEAELVELIVVDGASVTARAVVTGFDSANVTQVMRAMVQAVRDVPAVESAHIELVSPSSGGGATGVDASDTVIAVANAKGGVGKSTVPTGLVCTLADKHSAGLFDVNIHGPNIPSLLDVEGPVHSDDEGHPLSASVTGPDVSFDVVSVGSMGSDAPLARRGMMAHDVLTELFTDTVWSADDTLVLSLPPGTGDMVLMTSQEIPVDGVVVVTTPFKSSLEDTAWSVGLFQDNEVPVPGVVINMCKFVRPSRGDTHRLSPGEITSERLDAMVLAGLLFSPQFQEASAPGGAVPVFETLAESVSEAAAATWDVDTSDGALGTHGDSPERRKKWAAERFTVLANGETFALVSDRDPAPVRRFLGGLTDCVPVGVDGLSVERRMLNDQLLTAARP